MTSQLEQYETLVREIYPKVDLEVARFVDQALGKVCQYVPPERDNERPFQSLST